MLTLRMTNDGSREITTNIITGTFRFVTHWNYSTNMWYVDIYRFNGTPYLLGKALVPTINIMKANTVQTEETGEIRVADVRGTGNATVNTLGVDAFVTTWLPGEFEETFPEPPVELPVTPVDLDDILQ